MPHDWSRFWIKYHISREGEPTQVSGPVFDIDEFEKEFGPKVRDLMSQTFHDRAHKEVDPKCAKRYPGEVVQLKKKGIDVEDVFAAQANAKFSGTL